MCKTPDEDLSADDLDRITIRFTTKPLGEGTDWVFRRLLGIVKSHLELYQVESQQARNSVSVLFPALESAPSPSVGVSDDVLPTGRGEADLGRR